MTSLTQKRRTHLLEWIRTRGLWTYIFGFKNYLFKYKSGGKAACNRSYLVDLTERASSEKGNPIILMLSTHNCTSSLSNRTSSPGLKAGNPIYGHPSHRNASPNAQFPHEPTLPCTVKSTSARSSAFSFASAWSALERLAASSASSFSARPQVQSLHARLRLPVLGRHSGATKKSQCKMLVKGGDVWLTLDDIPLHVLLVEQRVLVNQLVV